MVGCSTTEPLSVVRSVTGRPDDVVYLLTRGIPGQLVADDRGGASVGAECRAADVRGE
jgi:hypothetical protein